MKFEIPDELYCLLSGCLEMELRRVLDSPTANEHGLKGYVRSLHATLYLLGKQWEKQKPTYNATSSVERVR